LAFKKIESEFSAPTESSDGLRFYFHYPEQNINQAIFLKFARLLSLLNALDLLIEYGFAQEQGILQRAIDETNENIFFLAVAVTNGEQTPLHEEFLSEFWKEDYSDPSQPVASRIPRGQPRRSKIRAFLNRIFGQANPSGADAVGRTISEMYSGFVHGAAPHIFELYDETSLQFSLNGIGQSIRFIDYVLDAQNAYYRSLHSGVMVAKALGFADVLTDVTSAMDEFRLQIGIENLEKQ
jgi:hypothetical protein